VFAKWGGKEGVAAKEVNEAAGESRVKPMVLKVKQKTRMTLKGKNTSFFGVGL